MGSQFGITGFWTCSWSGIPKNTKEHNVSETRSYTYILLCSLEYRTMDKFQKNPVIPSVIHRRQNPLESTRSSLCACFCSLILIFRPVHGFLLNLVWTICRHRTPNVTFLFRTIGNEDMAAILTCEAGKLLAPLHAGSSSGGRIFNFC
jgi:hypothetical protein